MIEVDVEFQDKAMKTPIYVKMDAPEGLLLSEGVCRQLGIIDYHPEVQSATESSGKEITKTAGAVQTVRIRLVQDVHLVPNECVTARVQLDVDMGTMMQPWMAESDRTLVEEKGFQLLDVVLPPI